MSEERWANQRRYESLMIWAMTTHNRAWFTWIQEQSNKYLQNAELEALEIRWWKECDIHLSMLTKSTLINESNSEYLLKCWY